MRVARDRSVDEATRGEQTENMSRVAIVCTGLGRIKRGFETLARDLFHGLVATRSVDAWLYKGGGRSAERETTVPNVYRDSLANRALCVFFGTGRRFYFEYLSFCVFLGLLISRRRHNVVYTLEPPIYKFLLRWRRLTGSRFALVHSTSGQLADIPAEEGCFIHHCTPCYVEKADALGFPRERQFIIPQFLFFKDIPPLLPNEDRALVRRELGLPEDRSIILSVGSLDRSVKRMDYVITETARYTHTGANPLLVMLGQVDPQTSALRELAETELGADAFVMKTVSRAELWNYYQAADVFVSASLREGFGFVYVEALATGLPVIAHDYDVSRYVLAERGIFGDLERAGVLSSLLQQSLVQPRSNAERAALREYVRERFDWSSVSTDYVRMFETAAGSTKVRSSSRISSVPGGQAQCRSVSRD